MMLRGNIAHDIVQCSLSCISTVLPTEGGGVIEFDDHRQRGPAVGFCGAPRWSQSPAVGALGVYESGAAGRG